MHTDGLDSDGLDSGEFLRWHEQKGSSLGHPCLTNNNEGFKRGTLGRDAKKTKNDEHGYRTKTAPHPPNISQGKNRKKLWAGFRAVSKSNRGHDRGV